MSMSSMNPSFPVLVASRCLVQKPQVKPLDLQIGIHTLCVQSPGHQFLCEWEYAITRGDPLGSPRTAQQKFQFDPSPIEKPESFGTPEYLTLVTSPKCLLANCWLGANFLNKIFKNERMGPGPHHCSGGLCFPGHRQVYLFEILTAGTGAALEERVRLSNGFRDLTFAMQQHSESKARVESTTDTLWPQG
jgi:hypothetical protein